MKQKILIVEDDAILRTALEHKLERLEYEVVVAGDGKEGLDVFVNERPDAIVLDIMLPEKDGADLLEDIRALPEGKDTPVVVLTNADDLGYVARTTNSNVEAYLVKSDQSLDQVVTFLEKKLRLAQPGS